MFRQSEIAFQPGLYANRSRRASKQRWVDGDLVRFQDGVPAQMGGWQVLTATGEALAGAACGIIAWRPNDDVGRYAAIGTDAGAFLYDGTTIVNISPVGFVQGVGSTAIGDGWGAGRFGLGTFGTPRAPTGNLADASNWLFDMYGETLLGCFTSDGLIYEFTVGADARLAPILGAPTARAMCVSDERHVFAFGADGVPGRVLWSDRENYAVWEAEATNRAGGYDLQVTSSFQCGHRCRGQILGWTATEVWAFAPLGNALVYDREKLAANAGAAGPRVVAIVTDTGGESAYWVGRDNFWMFDGYVRILDCELHDYVFKDINLPQAARFHTRVNGAFNEVWFWYCSASSNEVDRAVVFSFKSGTWTKASVARLAWQDAGVFDAPIAVDGDGALYVHETGETDAGDPLASFVMSHPITVGVGQQFAEIDQFWPDMQADSAPCAVAFVCRESPGGEAVTIGPFDFAIGDAFVPLNIATREFQVRIEGRGGRWELGLPLLSMQGGSLR